MEQMLNGAEAIRLSGIFCSVVWRIRWNCASEGYIHAPGPTPPGCSKNLKIDDLRRDNRLSGAKPL